MKKMLVVLMVLFSASAYGMGLTVQDLISDYNNKFPVKGWNCDSVSTDLYRAIDQNFQKSNLQMIAIKTGEADPITRKDGHRIVTYTEGRRRVVITTKQVSGSAFELVREDRGYSTLHEICLSFVPNYKFIAVYRKGFGWIPKSRQSLMHEAGLRPSEESDVWSRVGVYELKENKVWSA